MAQTSPAYVAVPVTAYDIVKALRSGVPAIFEGVDLGLPLVFAHPSALECPT